MKSAFEEIKKAMTLLGKKNDTIFIGQTVEYPGSPMYNSLDGVPKSKKLEMPVFEDTQMGISIGLSLNEFVPITIFPRIDFLICAINQLINHLDKIKEMSHDEWQPGVIIRTQIGNTAPLYPGLQHCGDYTEGLKSMCKNINIIVVDDEKNIMTFYKAAYIAATNGISTILIETPQGGSEKNFHKVETK